MDRSPTSKTSSYILPFALPILVLILGPAGSGMQGAIATDGPATAPVANTQPALRPEYDALLKELGAYNAEGMDSWTMNSEHLFAGAGDLRDRAISFVRRRGALDLLFSRLLDEKADAPEVLADAELLVYFGQYRLDGDQRLWSERAREVLEAVDKGRLANAEAKYPRAPIKEQVLRAARLSERHYAASTRPAR